METKFELHNDFELFIKDDELFINDDGKDEKIDNITFYFANEDDDDNYDGIYVINNKWHIDKECNEYDITEEYYIKFFEGNERLASEYYYY